MTKEENDTNTNIIYTQTGDSYDWPYVSTTVTRMDIYSGVYYYD